MVQVIPCSLKEWQARYLSGAFEEDPVAFGYGHYECSLEGLRAKNAFLGPVRRSQLKNANILAISCKK
jgi:hypothetical protein